MSVAAIILAAGASTRLGSPKQLIMLHGETLLDRAVRIAREADCSPIVVILGASAAPIQAGCRLTGATVLLNEQWSEGMSSSLRLGIASVPHREGAIVMTCDMPAVTPAHLRALRHSGALTASRYSQRNGVPAFFPQDSFADLMALEGDTGARTLLRSAHTVDLPAGDHDIDRPEDVRRMLQRFVV